MNVGLVGSLRIRAAVASGWPTVVVTARDEVSALRALARIEQVSPCPQADLLEPEDPDEPWVLRVALPGWGTNEVELLDRDLRAGDLDVRWEQGQLPGWWEAVDSGHLSIDGVEGDPPAVGWFDDLGTPRIPPIVEEDPKPDAAATASELVAALRDVSAELVPAGRLPVRHIRERAGGRRGFRVELPLEPQAHLPDGVLSALRQEVLTAIQAVIERRATSATPLDPDTAWDPRDGGAFLVWRIGDRGPAAPGDAVVEPGVSQYDWATACHRLHHLEVQIAPRASGDHDGLARAISEALDGAPWGGGPSRWLAVRDGFRVRPEFCPTWRAPVDDPGLSVTLSRIAARPDVFAVRVVPGLPLGLEDAATTLDPAWYLAGGRCLVRWRDGARGDRIVATVPRAADPADAEVLDATEDESPSGSALAPLRVEGRHLRLIADEHGRPGYEMRWHPTLLDQPVALGMAVNRALARRWVGCSPVLDFALLSQGPRVLAWRATESDAPLWVSVD